MVEACCSGLGALLGDDDGMLSGGGGGRSTSACPSLALGKVMHHRTQQPTPEARTEKVVKDGVDDAVEHGETVDDIEEEVEQVDQVAVEGKVGLVQCE